ncbi:MULTISPECIES: SCO family protein [Flavobacteriaceae]|uniref:SCO family protein n=1 Tax=Flavobacteriaceae TaxID=49546 RepID=UPI00234A5C00|nr:SCO family protein [Muricauda sp. SP22]MDC6363160.1 SCO family protein [Muricauda sp. SP22]
MGKPSSLKQNGSKIPMVLIALGILAVVYGIFKNNPELPVLGPKDFNAELVDVSFQNNMAPHRVANFELINQNGEIITQEDYGDKIYVTDFFFTRCPSICPIMTNHMEQLQEVFRDTPDVMFLSISVTPEMDSVPILKEYALRNGVLDSKWNITTGNKEHIYNLARKSYFAAVDYGDGGLQDFIHTPNFVLVDKKKQIRGVYDGTNNDEIHKLIDAIKTLTE